MHADVYNMYLESQLTTLFSITYKIVYVQILYSKQDITNCIIHACLQYIKKVKCELLFISLINKLRYYISGLINQFPSIDEHEIEKRVQI